MGGRVWLMRLISSILCIICFTGGKKSINLKCQLIMTPDPTQVMLFPETLGGKYTLFYLLFCCFSLKFLLFM